MRGRARGGGGRRWLLVGAGLILLLGLALVGPPAGGPARLDGPGGTLALRQLYAARGIAVGDAPDAPSAPDAFVLLSDFRDSAEAERLLAWAADGGRLVVADPLSAVVAAAGAKPGGRAAGFIGSTGLEPGCLSPLAAGVEHVEVTVGERALTSDRPETIGCFPAGDGALALVVQRGRGTVVLLGGWSALTNERLAHADNARFALRLVGDARRVVFGTAAGPPSAAPPRRGLWSLLPSAARVALAGIALAAVAFALSRARRLGRPLDEAPLSPIASGELVQATGRLYRSARATAHAGTILRNAVVVRLSGRLGLPPGTDAGAVAKAIAPLDPAAARWLTGPEPRSDAELVLLAAGLDAVSRRVDEALR